MTARTIGLCAAILAGILLVTAVCHAADHPTARSATKKHTPVTKEEMAKSIEQYVKKDAALRGGYFLVYDTVAKKPLALSLEKVHHERLSTVTPQTYSACVDFKTPEGKAYDLDLFMKGPDKDHLAVTEISIHKESGKARYTWHEQGGVWKKKFKGAAEKSPDHPKGGEHPK